MWVVGGKVLCCQIEDCDSLHSVSLVDLTSKRHHTKEKEQNGESSGLPNIGAEKF